MKVLKFVPVLVFISQLARAQDTLPQFGIKDLGKNRVSIHWVNPYKGVIQLNIQRSTDSVKNYRTVWSAPFPNLPQNGFVDPAGGGFYYRIFYVLDGNAYFFSKPRRLGQGFEDRGISAASAAGRLIEIMVSDSVIARLPFSSYARFRDSVISQTRDSLFTLSDERVALHRYSPDGNSWRASVNLFTNREGNVILHLPDASVKKYKLIVFDSNGKELFHINHVSDTELMLDKSDFFHAGWFSFELYEDDKLKERNKFYLTREFP